MNLQEIKQRTKSIKNTLQITKAMELIASIKMKKAIDTAETSRVYSEKADELLVRLSAEGKTYRHPMLLSPDVKKSLLIIVSSDRGLCGSLNTEIFREAYKFIDEEKKQGRSVSAILVGNKARNHFLKIKNLTCVADFGSLGESVEFLETSPIAQMVIDEFSKGEYAKVQIAYKKFESIVRQIAEVKQVLPLHRDDPVDRLDKKEVRSQKLEVSSKYQFEPEPEKVLDMILPQLVKMTIFQTILENNASEHASRMVAMKNASDAGLEIVEDLEFTYNRLRQEKITSEISEIAAGAEAMAV